MKKKLLIAGDSFAADWTKKYENICGWVNMLESDYDVTNIAQAGVSEYKIYKQLEKIDTTKFEHIIVSHTSAYRIPIEEHPIHKDDLLHDDCDIIYSDAEVHIENNIMKTAVDFYVNIFHPEYFCFVNDLIFKEIQKITPNAIHITFFDNFYDNSILKFEDIFLSHKGNINHLDEKGNSLFYNTIKNILNEKEIISK
jgi:hypothetical protein